MVLKIGSYVFTPVSSQYNKYSMNIFRKFSIGTAHILYTIWLGDTWELFERVMSSYLSSNPTDKNIANNLRLNRLFTEGLKI